MSTPTTLPYSSLPLCNQQSFFIDGPVGQLACNAFVPRSDAILLPIVAVLCHPHPLYGGTMNNKVITTLGRAFASQGIASVRFNFRGVGESHGQYDNGFGEVEDTLAVIDWLQPLYPNAALWLAGFSFGSYIAAQTALQRKTQQLISIAPPVTHFDFTTLPRPQCPWLVIQGEEDEVIASDSVFSWADTVTPAVELIRVPATGHFFHQKLTHLTDLIANHVAHVTRQFSPLT